MLKVFVSCPMRDIPDEEVLATMEAARKDAEAVTGEKCELIDSFHKIGLTKRIECLGNSIQMMQEADVVYFVKGMPADVRLSIRLLCCMARIVLSPRITTSA